MSRAKIRESQIWQWLKTAKTVLGSDLHLSRIENSAGMGMADVEGCLRGAQFWMELKSEALPVSPHTAIAPRFEYGQPAWHRRRSLAGGTTFVLLQLGSGRDACRYLLLGSVIPELESGLSAIQLEHAALLPHDCTAVDIVLKAAGISYHQ